MKFKHILALAAATLSLAAQAASYNQNLISNGAAESGVSGWTAFDGYDLFQSVNYGSNWVLPTQPGPVDRGSKMFTGVGGQSAGFQIIDVSSLTATGAPVEYSTGAPVAVRLLTSMIWKPALWPPTPVNILLPRSTGPGCVGRTQLLP